MLGMDFGRFILFFNFWLIFAHWKWQNNIHMPAHSILILIPHGSECSNDWKENHEHSDRIVAHCSAQLQWISARINVRLSSIGSPFRGHLSCRPSSNVPRGARVSCHGRVFHGIPCDLHRSGLSYDGPFCLSECPNQPIRSSDHAKIQAFLSQKLSPLWPSS